jgi:hypothetical protein
VVIAIMPQADKGAAVPRLMSAADIRHGVVIGLVRRLPQTGTGQFRSAVAARLGQRTDVGRSGTGPARSDIANRAGGKTVVLAEAKKGYRGARGGSHPCHRNCWRYRIAAPSGNTPNNSPHMGFRIVFDAK